MQDDEKPPAGGSGSDERDRDADPKAPDDVELARWWRAYCRLPEPRPWTRLREMVGGAKSRVRRAVLEGWPDLGIVAFKDREVLDETAEDAIVERVKERAVGAAVEVIANRWDRDAREHIANLPAMGKAIAKLIDTIQAASEHVSFVKYRRVPDLDAHGVQKRDAAGNPVYQLKPYVSGPDIALAVQRIAAAQKDHAILNKALLDSLAPFRESAIDFSGAPPEVLDWLQKHFAGRAA